MHREILLELCKSAKLSVGLEGTGNDFPPPPSILPPSPIPPSPSPPLLSSLRPPLPPPAPRYSSELGRPTCRVQLSLNSGCYLLGVFGEHRTPMCAGCWNCAVRLARSHHVQLNPRPVLLVSVRTLLQETLALHGPARVSDLRDEQAAADAHRGEPTGDNCCTVPFRLRYRWKGNGLWREGMLGLEREREIEERGSGRYKGLSIRWCGCDAKVPNIPEVKVNRLRCCTLQEISSSKVICFSRKKKTICGRDAFTWPIQFFFKYIT